MFHKYLYTCNSIKMDISIVIATLFEKEVGK